MLESEIVENALHLESTTLVTTLHELRALGAHVAIDDFGTGFASLNALSDLPVNAVTIDRRFLAGPGRDRPSTAILHAIVALAQSLDLTVTAEGIETAQQLAHVRSIGIDRGQGYYFSKPLPAASIERLIVNRSPLDARLLAIR
jgi:EAL domain-containing protein (putative c-di-GMP-specific phosphodiesterase class I)